MHTPHIILITADQMRACDMGFMGAPVHTPNLDELARRGAVLTNAFCVSPVCTPSRAALFTGRYPHSTGAWNIGVAMNEDELTLCDHINPLGYRCVAHGKMHLRPECQPWEPGKTEPGKTGSTKASDPAFTFRGRERDGTYFGFDEHHIAEDNRVGEYLDWLKTTAPEWVANQPNTDAVIRDGVDRPTHLHMTRWIGDRSVETIEQHDTNRPLFMWTSFVDPHHPFDAPREYVEKYRSVEVPMPRQHHGEHDDRPEHLRSQGSRGWWPGGGRLHDFADEKMRDIIRNTYAMIHFIDDEIGRILSALEAQGMRQDAIIVFTADHGEYLGDHGLIMKGPWLRDCLTRVPMLFQGPGIHEGLYTGKLMENVDVVPTLLELIGQAVPYGIQGRSLLPVLQGADTVARTSAITSYDAHDRGIRQKSIRTAHFKLNVFAGETYAELYDLTKDPDEFNNVYSDPAYAQIKSDLQTLLIHRLMEDEDPLPERRCFW